MYPMICPGNGYIMFRHDGIFIDGREDGPSAMLRLSASSRDAAARKDADPEIEKKIAAESKWAIGHLVNHPPAGTMPNVETKPVDIDESSPAEVSLALSKINFNFRKPCAGDKLLRTVVLVSKRDLENEEIWLDYKLESDNAPLWYSPVKQRPP